MTTPQRYETYIGGTWGPSQSGQVIDTINPYTNDVWAQIPACGAADVDRAVEAADAALRGPWGQMSASARGRLMHKLADAIEAEAERLGRIETIDNGKLINEMAAQARALPSWFRYFGGLADKIEGRVVPADKPELLNMTWREPLGVCAMIVPWNSPLLLVGWKLAPALAAGCTAVIKPSEFTSASMLEFAKLVDAVGFPPGVINVVTGYGQEVGEPLVQHPKVAKVAFTGGQVSGQRVYENAARGLKKATLELGGKSPNIVFDDANLDAALMGAVSGIFAATGQTCNAGSRLLLHDAIHDEFVEKLVAFSKTARMGDPLDPKTQVGPVTTPGQYKKILDYIEIAKTEGATVALGGGAAPAEAGGGTWFVQPTIFTGVHNKMRIAQEEVFGPVLSVLRFSDLDEAIEIANDVIYGLASGVWTRDINKAITVAKRLKAGTVWTNTYRTFSPSMPFGGYKQSGLGRESGMEAVDAYLQTKSVWINTGEDANNPFVMRV